MNGDPRGHSQPPQRVRLAIVGCGANGVAVFNDLIAAIARTPAPRMFEVDVYEHAQPIGSGLAYGTVLDQHILNMRASTMSAVPDQPNHFLAWLIRTQPAGTLPVTTRAADADDFVSRRVFGAYLRDLLRDAQDMARAIGVKVDMPETRLLQELPRDARVMILGSGLTAVDVVDAVNAPGTEPRSATRCS